MKPGFSFGAARTRYWAVQYRREPLRPGNGCPGRPAPRTLHGAGCYPNMYYLSMTEMPDLLLRLMARPGWHERLVNCLLSRGEQAARWSSIENDGMIDLGEGPIPVLVAFDCNIPRLIRFHTASKYSPIAYGSGSRLLPISNRGFERIFWLQRLCAGCWAGDTRYSSRNVIDTPCPATRSRGILPRPARRPPRRQIPICTPPDKRGLPTCASVSSVSRPATAVFCTSTRACRGRA